MASTAAAATWFRSMDSRSIVIFRSVMRVMSRQSSTSRTMFCALRSKDCAASLSTLFPVISLWVFKIRAQPMMGMSGFLISWLRTARNSSLARLAFSALSRSTINCW